MLIGVPAPTAKVYVNMLNINFKIYRSEKASINNLLIDTCVLSNLWAQNIIRKAKYCTVTLATIEELDSVSSFSTNKPIEFKRNIRHFELSILLKKFNNIHLANFNAKKGEYVDNVLIEYLKILPDFSRPTLITSDLNLALKAHLYGFEYIYIH